MDLSTGAAIREDALSAAAASYCRGAAAMLLLLLLAAVAAAAAAASTTTALLTLLRLVTFRTGMIILELATTAVSTFYLCSLQPRQAA